MTLRAPPREHMVIVLTAATVIAYFLFVFMNATDHAQVEAQVAEALDMTTMTGHDDRVHRALVAQCKKYRELGVSSNADHLINLHQENELLLEIYNAVATQLNTQTKSMSDEEYVAFIDSLRTTLNKLCGGTSTLPPK